MVDNQENILVELDYDNISLIDPNKVIDEEGNVKDRLVRQEDLVMYANLECNVLPRTKLAVGTAMNDSQRTISVGKINFLNPGDKTFLNTAWADELTGKDTLEGKGVNQPKQTAVKNPNKSDDYYITQNLNSNGTPGATDNGLLGLKSINMEISTSFLPIISIELEDIKGRALFESGNNSPYAAFFQLPYPQFTLTLKGWYGKAVKFPIMLQSFTSRFDPSTHNFHISLKFYGYKYTLLSYVNFGALMAVPQMYNNTVTQAPVSQTQGNEISSSNTVVAPTVVSRGYQKMKEVYSIYKSKGLIEDNFPEITLVQLKYRLQNFIKEVLDQFEKENMGILTDMTVYQNNVLQFQQNIFLYANSSWYNTYMDTSNPIVLKEGSQNVYIFKESNSQSKIDAEQKLKGEIDNYKDILSQNGVFGANGKYTVGGITTPSEIKTPITLDTLQIKELTLDKIDLVKTYVSQKNAPKGNFVESDAVIQQFKQTLKANLDKNFGTVYKFEGPASFMNITDNMSKSASETRKKVETAISASLATKFNSQGTGSLGFVPSIRNILAVFYCQGESFLRLLDDVHKKAWDQRENEYRRAAIFSTTSTAPSVDVKTSTQNNEPIYPWPQVIRESVSEDNKEKFEIIYPGDQTVASQYRAYSPEVWPEVEFVEQFIKGYVQRQTTADKDAGIFEVTLQPARISLNAIDFTVSNEVFQNKEESKYFYEIYERLMLNAFYTRFNKKSGYVYSLYEIEADDEAVNMLQSLGADNPFLTKKIKEYLLDSNNYVPFLKHISNQGQGESWQTFVQGDFVTPYIRNDVRNPNVIYNGDIFDSLKSQPSVSLTTPKSLVNIDKYLTGSSITNEFDFVDTYPITNFEWDKKNLADGKSLNNVNEVYDTKQVISYNDIQKTICNFDLNDTDNTKRPFTHFNFANLSAVESVTNFKSFYTDRTYDKQVATEGNLEYNNYEGFVGLSQTTSMLNTPYFVNAIQKGVFNFRYKSKDLSPYKSAAYLFLNSLPLGTLREKYKTLNGEATTDLSYIISTLKKFGAVHRLPYAWILKYGSIWHRYKTYNKTGVDFLDEVWTNFDYKKNWDPATSASTYAYNLVIDGTPRNLVLDNTTGTPQFTDINTGFYPQLIDDYNVFIQGTKLFSGQTQNGGTCFGVNITGSCTTFEVTGTCSSTGVGITIDSINKNFIQLPDSIFIPQFNANIQLLTQTSGTAGGAGVYTTPAPFNVSFTDLPFKLGTYAEISNNTDVPIQVGQILSGSSTTGVTVLNFISSSATTTTTPPAPQNPLLSPPPNEFGNPVVVYTLANNDILVVFSRGFQKYVVLKDPNGVILHVGEEASNTYTNDILVKEIIQARFGSMSTNPNDPQYIVKIQSIAQFEGLTGTTTTQALEPTVDYLCKVSNVSGQTFNYVVINPPIQVTQVTSNVLTAGAIINGQFLNGDVVILSQISGTTGGVGLYQTTNIGLQTTPSSFVVKNSFVQGIGSSQIQNYLNTEKLLMFNTQNSTMFESAGFDPSNSTRSMRVSPWSVLVRDVQNPDDYYIVPSFGSNVNQAKEEAFKNGTMKFELSDNPAMFNGTVRMFWNTPQYGWFDNSKLVKNNPKTYLKQILNEQKSQQNFLISGNNNIYTNFEELFTTFNLELLDQFETHFLNFSKSLYDFADILPSNSVQEETTVAGQGRVSGTDDVDKSFQNFHLLMRSLMKVDKPSGTSPENKLQSAIENQNTTFQTVLTSFLNYDVAFKFGNPSDYNKRLFYTFSTQYIENPITYSQYEKGNLPPEVTLSQSKTQNPKTWEALEYYVGNSTIPQLEYKDSGSYITDFFIDLNVQFNEKNVIDFAPLIKIYATQKLNGLSIPTPAQPVNVPPPNPVPPPANVPQPNPQISQYPYTGGTNGSSGGASLKEISTLQDGNKVYVYQAGPRCASVIRNSSGVVLRQTSLLSENIDQSRNNIIKAQYGSLSVNQTDPQFITNIENIATSSQNVQVPAQVPTQQQAPTGLPTNTTLLNSSSNLAKFYKLMDLYIEQNNLYIGNVLNTMLPSVRKQLPNIFIGDIPGAERAPLEAGFTEQTRLELWETFKALNDTWIAGFDFESKTLFEDVLLVDRASRNVGDKVLVDIYQIIDLLEDGASDKNQGSTSYKNTLLDMVTTILTQNNFQHFMLPAYVNFYNAQDAQKNPTPRPDGTMEVGNMMFGTFLNVDYRQSSPKFLCYYVSKPSEHLNMNNNIDYRFRDDAFDLRRASDNPLTESQSNKTDWDKSNKVVGFNVDVTRENQQIFKSFSVTQDPGKPTTESLEMLNQMANVDRNRRSTTQSVSLYNLYKNRSYGCSVEMMGCALIQPMMYFNIRNVPMFSGPYMITKVSHNISEGEFNTSFEGVRQPFYSLPTIDNFLQTLNTQILSQLQGKIVENETQARATSDNVLFQASNVISNLDTQDTLTKNQDCSNELNSRYNGFTVVDLPQSTTLSTNEFMSMIRSNMIERKYDMTGITSIAIASMAFTYVYVDSGSQTQLSSYENNYSTINLKEVYGDSFFQYINRKYFCVARGTDKNIPVVSFRSPLDFVNFVLNRVAGIYTFLNQDLNEFANKFPNNNDLVVVSNLAKQYVLHYPVNQNSDVYVKIEKNESGEYSKLIAEFNKAYSVFKTLWDK
jgi:hypothetical protein